LDYQVKKLVGLTASVALAAGIAVAASAPAQAASVTKSCSTGGYWYMTDTMYVTKTYLGSSQWQYKVTRSANRTLTVNINGTYHYVQHTAVALNQYISGTSTVKKTYPANTTYMYSRRGDNDFGMWFDVTDHATMNEHKGCYIYF
jgi:hypothetical protein